MMKKIVAQFVCSLSLGLCGVIFSTNKAPKATELMYKSVSEANVTLVKKLLTLNSSLAHATYNGKHMLYGLLEATQEKNYIEEEKLKNYAEIVSLLSKKATIFKIKVTNRSYQMTPVNYALVHCHPLICKALTDLENRPQGYAPKTEKPLHETRRMIKESEEVVVPFLKKTFDETTNFFKKNCSEDATLPEILLETKVKNTDGNTLAWKIDRGIFLDSQFITFFLELLVQDKKVCNTTFNILDIHNEKPYLEIYIGLIESTESERQKGYGSLIISLLLKAFALHHNKVCVTLIAEPPYKDKEQKELFMPRLVSFYKSLGFRVKDEIIRNLFLWIIQGKIQHAWDPNALNYPK